MVLLHLQTFPADKKVAKQSLSRISPVRQDAGEKQPASVAVAVCGTRNSRQSGGDRGNFQIHGTMVVCPLMEAFLFFKFYFTVIDLQCCVNFCCAAK